MASGLGLKCWEFMNDKYSKGNIVYVFNRSAKTVGTFDLNFFMPRFLHEAQRKQSCRNTLISLFIKPLILITLNTTDNPHDGYSKFCFQGKVEQYPVNKGLTHIMNKEDKKRIY